MRSKLPLLLVLLVAIALGTYLAIFKRSEPPQADPVRAAQPSAASPTSGAEAKSANLEAAGAALGAAPAEASERKVAALPTPAAADPRPEEASREVQPKSLVRGRVVDGNARPIPGAEVREAWLAMRPGNPSETQAISDAEGRFELEVDFPEDRSRAPVGLNIGPRLEVLAKGFAPLRQPYSPLPDGPVDVGDLVLSPGLVLTGRVVDHAGAGVSGAELFASKNEGTPFEFMGRSRHRPSGLTDSNGYFELASLDFAPWTVRVEHPRYPSLVVRGALPEQGTRLEGQVFEMKRPAAIGGAVIGRPSGSSEALEVRARGLASGGFGFGMPARRAPVEASGRFRLEGLEAGAEYKLDVGPAPKTEARQGLDFGNLGTSYSEAVSIQAGTEGVQLAYQRGADLCFSVVDQQTGAPIERFRADLQLGFRSESRGKPGEAAFPGGRLCFEDLHPPSREQAAFGLESELRLRADGYSDRAVPLPDLKPGDSVDLGVLALEPVPRLTVVVLDDASAEPLPGATVQLEAIDAEDGVSLSISVGDSEEPEFNSGGAKIRAQTGSTDKSGEVAFNAFSGVPAKLVVTREGFAPRVLEPLQLDAGQASRMEVRLGRGGRVRVAVLDTDGVPLPGAKVVAAPVAAPGGRRVPFGPRSPLSAELRSDGEGLAVFENLAPGTYGLELVADAANDGPPIFFSFDVAPSASAEVQVEVQEGQQVEATLVAKALGNLSGRILEAGQVLVGAQVSLTKQGADPQAFLFGGGRSARRDANGRYLIEGLETGDYTVSVSAPSRASAYESQQRIEVGDNRLDLDLTVAELSGRVLDPHGEPIAGVEVRAELAQPGNNAVTMIRSAVMLSDGGGGGVFNAFGGPRSNPTLTDKDGRYRLRGVTPGKALVVRAEPGPGLPFVKAGSSEPVSVEDGSSQQVSDLILEVAGELVVHVLAADGKPAAGVFLHARAEGDEPGGFGDNFQMVDDQGNAKFSGLEPGNWTVTANSMGNSSKKASDKAQVEAGKSQELTLRMP